MSAEVRKRAPFELLAFTAAPVAGALVVVELEGRFAQSARFTRQPVLVVEPGEERPRLQLAPVRSTLTGGRWRGAYAIPAEALPDARFALGLRGTLLELPAPDEPDDAERLTALAREANALRRALETAEADAVTARAEADAASAELGAAVLAARDGALAEATDRIATLEAELAEAHRAATAAVTAAREEAEALHAAAAADAQARAAQATAVHAAALAEAQSRAAAAEAGAADAAAAAAADAEARARTAEETAAATGSGIEVLRAELAEERERAGGRIGELEAELSAAQRRIDALRNATAAEPAAGDAATQRLAITAEPAAVGDAAKRPLAPAAAGDDPTRPLTPVEEPEASRPLDDARRSPTRRGQALDPIAPASTQRTAPRGAGPWLAVGALLLFAFVLLGLLLGFLP